ncbi:MAG: hypothetical protein PUE51_07725, partial [Veillonellaceae bacterium]|nr:hypothetical protein [Veillonellaceae bacterium]
SNAGCHGARTPKTTAKRESHLIPIDAPPGVLMGIFSVLGYVMLLGAYKRPPQESVNLRRSILKAGDEIGCYLPAGKWQRHL